MSITRAIVLVNTLAALLACGAGPLQAAGASDIAASGAAAVAGNSVSGMTVQRSPEGKWIASFDYVFTGEPEGAELVVDLFGTASVAGPATASDAGVARVPAQRGAHHASIEIALPKGLPAMRNVSQMTTYQVAAQLRSGARVIAGQQIQQAIEWTVDREQYRGPPEEVLAEAIRLIDLGYPDSLHEARRLLEQLVARNPSFGPAYVELARVAMKTHWGPEGLHQAENLLASALQLRADDVNAKILLGYVYAHQKRFTQAESLFLEASRTDTKNLWLWANWGELLVMQGQSQPAIQKYREAVKRPRSHDTYDRARLDAYDNLLSLLEDRKDVDGMEALQKQRADEFGPGSCHSAEYARFLLQHRGDAASAIRLGRQAVDGQCHDRVAREVLGMAHYVAWSAATGSQRNESLNQARAFWPAGPRLFYELATSDRMLNALQQLVAGGEPIDQLDNDKLDALAHALQRRDLHAARRLLRLGARPDAIVGAYDMPVALLPVMSVDLEGIRLMREFGVNYATLRYRGFTAMDHARQSGDRSLLEALDSKAGGL